MTVCTRVFKGHEGPVYCGVFEHTGTYVLTGGHDKRINLHNTNTGAHVSTYSGHAWEVFDLAIAPSGNTFLSGGGDRTLFLWDVASQRIIRRFTGHYQRINAVHFGKVAVSASYDRTVRIWDVRAGRFPVMVLEEARDSVTSVDVKDEKILTGSVDGHVRCYDIRMGQLCVDDIQKSVTCVRFTEDCSAYLVASLDSTIRLMDVSSGSVLNTFSGHTNLKYRINATLLDNDAHIAGGSEDGSLFIWDLLTGEQQQKLLQHTAPVTSVSVHSKTSGLLTCSLDGTARLWNQ